MKLRTLKTKRATLSYNSPRARQLRALRRMASAIRAGLRTPAVKWFRLDA